MQHTIRTLSMCECVSADHVGATVVYNVLSHQWLPVMVEGSMYELCSPCNQAFCASSTRNKPDLECFDHTVGYLRLPVSAGAHFHGGESLVQKKPRDIVIHECDKFSPQGSNVTAMHCAQHLARRCSG